MQWEKTWDYFLCLEKQFHLTPEPHSAESSPLFPISLLCLCIFCFFFSVCNNHRSTVIYLVYRNKCCLQSFFHLIHKFNNAFFFLKDFLYFSLFLYFFLYICKSSSIFGFFHPFYCMFYVVWNDGNI